MRFVNTELKSRQKHATRENHPTIIVWICDLCYGVEFNRGCTTNFCAFSSMLLIMNVADLLTSHEMCTILSSSRIFRSRLWGFLARTADPRPECMCRGRISASVHIVAPIQQYLWSLHWKITRTYAVLATKQRSAFGRVRRATLPE